MLLRLSLLRWFNLLFVFNFPFYLAMMEQKCHWGLSFAICVWRHSRQAALSGSLPPSFHGMLLEGHQAVKAF